MKVSNKLISIIIAFVICIGVFSISASASEISVDEYLKSKGVTQEIIEKMPTGQKELVFKNLKEGAQFESFEQKEYVVDVENNALLPTPYLGALTSSDITISVIAFYNSGIEYSIFPSFVWKKAVKVRNNSFGMALYPGWEAIPGYNAMLMDKKFTGR